LFAEVRVAAARAADAPGSCHREEIPAVLAELEATLRDFSSATYSLAHALVTRPRVGEPVWRDYSRGEGGGEPSQSNELEAQALAALHELGASIGGAARRCRAALELLAPPEAPGGDERPAVASAQAAVSR
jgi:hypothetical protein